MEVWVAESLEQVFDALDSDPHCQLLAGGTDFMVEVNFGHRRPSAVACLRRLEELRGWRREGDDVVLGAGLTYTEMMAAPLSDLLPGLAQAARSVGSPQIRNAGTLGGNLATASPAGDSLPILVALDAQVVVASRSGRRNLAVSDFFAGPKRHRMLPGELVLEVRVPLRPATQEFLKVGTRNAMVIAVASVALVVDWAERTVRCAMGSVGPTPLRAFAAEAWCASNLDWERRRASPAALDEFSQLVSASSMPIDDHRSTAAYRRHAVGVCARRALERALRSADHPEGERPMSEPSPAGGLGGYQLRINGNDHQVPESWIGESLLYVLRERLGLAGSKNACEQGECGSCSVLLDGVLVCACLVLAASAQGSEVVTVEGLAGHTALAGVLSDVQAAFLAEGAVQCGFCTPGLVMAVHDLLERMPDADELAVREAISGNLCRCTGYGRIFAAVAAAQSARGPRPGDSPGSSVGAGGAGGATR